jgi:hypothetical protein
MHYEQSDQVPPIFPDQDGLMQAIAQDTNKEYPFE